MAKVTFKTKDGRTVSFTPKKGKKTKKKIRRSTKRTTRTPVKTKKIKRSKMAKRGRKRSSSGGGSKGIMDTILGGAIAGVVGDMIPYGSIGKVAAGYLLGRKGGLVGNTAKAVAVVGAADFTRANIGGFAPSLGTVQASTSTSNSW